MYKYNKLLYLNLYNSAHNNLFKEKFIKNKRNTFP